MIRLTGESEGEFRVVSTMTPEKGFSQYHNVGSDGMMLSPGELESIRAKNGAFCQSIHNHPMYESGVQTEFSGRVIRRHTSLFKGYHIHERYSLSKRRIN